MDKGDLSGILNQFDMYHNGFLKETSLQNRYNNYYVGNGQLGMFVDALGAQSLPFIIDSKNLEYPEAADRDAIDVSIGNYKSSELLSALYHYGTSQQPTINYNESWVKSKWHEHGNEYGRGQLSIRNSIFPTIDNVFEANDTAITNYKQRMNLWNNCCITEFTYKQQLQVQITSYASWANNRVAVFHYKIKNISRKHVNAGCVAEPIVSYHGQRFNFTKAGKGLALHLKEDWLLHELSVYLEVSGIRTYTANETGKITVNSPLNPGDSSSFTIYQGIVTSKNASDPVLANTKEVDRLVKTNYDKVFKDHCNSVHEFWNRSYVLLPWKDLCKLYYRSALIIAGNLRYGDYYPCVSMLTSSSYTGFGWGMDNVPVYDFLMQTGREDYVLNVFKHFRKTMPTDSGNYGNQLNYSFGPNPWGTMVCSSSGNYAYLMHEYFSVTGDTTFLNNILYPQLKSFCNFWSGFANNEGGSYGFWTRERYNNKDWEVHTYDEPVFKYGINYHWGESDDVIDAVAPAKWTLETTAGLAKKMNVDTKLRAKWEDCNSRLILPQTDSFYLTYRNRTDSLAYNPDPFPKREVAACAQFNCVYPTFLDNMDTTKVFNTYRVIKNKDLLGWNFNYNLQLYDVVARLKMPEELEWLLTKSKINIRDRLDSAEYNTFSEFGQGKGAGYFLMPYGMLNVSINEMLLQSFNDTLQVFPCIMPAFVQKPLLFRNLQANKGFRVSATWENGKTQNIEILSRNGNVCVIKVPENWTYISVYNGNKRTEIKADKSKNSISFATLAGRTYLITDKR
ncbi:glycoside hydrolase family 95-like protein [Prolixibacter sp. SD074]|uniref:glycoside hydrolase family 95-like protein n=1 Tax=Prolixibacter sp. SD074 TaxID=2652391 RepID=UPI001288ECCC|nr:hypothetical protein [Prolixibacter sp. SD074]GET28873.1 hypothetical protein SD074_10750 [Prolixibacter sp. SD074]